MGEKIAVIGTGYVGLVSGACFAEIGHRVVCADVDEGKIERLRAADIPIYEPGLDHLVRRNLGSGRLRFTADIDTAVRDADIVYVAVGTPGLDSGAVDLSQVSQAVRQIAAHLNGYKIIVIKSTVPVGTFRFVEQTVKEAAGENARFDVVSNPEFLREGSAIRDSFHPDRIVIGATSDTAARRIARVHESMGTEVLFVDPESAELIKYASNAFLAAKISFINEMANVCEKTGADIALVARGMGMDRRIGPYFLQAGIGYGGSCFPKDTKAQLHVAKKLGCDMKILQAAIEVNERQRLLFADKVARALDGSVKDRIVAVMGLAFKPNTDDVREAPALDIIRVLRQSGAQMRAYDPVATEKAGLHLPGVCLYSDPYEAISGADAMVVCTEWDQVKNMDLHEVKRRLRTPVVVDGRNVFEPKLMVQLGFRYHSVGRKNVQEEYAGIV
ncbi:UDP-glucose dehydrogenase family protein [Paenibacillus hamazuiensis]|uniref:UDP-glucose dehydrogenase family protein n=1 Tax=Paenibacillus hamazuiensis TaxID=2936508 RepID=UPI00200C2C51|nr:UDP-glucose/GDP-mannose dehydrogenase family protein [Paenibacillus hamazuiensis]